MVNSEVTKSKIKLIDEAVWRSGRFQSPLVAAWERLLALRVKDLQQKSSNPPPLAALLNELPEIETENPRLQMAQEYQGVQAKLQQFLPPNALTKEEVTFLAEKRKNSVDLHEKTTWQKWWQIYIHALNCFMLTSERYGQELGLSRRQASESLMVSPTENLLDHQAHNEATHSLNTFVFTAKKNLRVDTKDKTYFFTPNGEFVDEPYNPWDVTDYPEIDRGFTDITSDPFIDLLVTGEGAGYLINHNLLTVQTSLANGQQEPALLQKALEENIQLATAVREAYRAFNTNPNYTQAHFGVGTRQFTVALHYTPSEDLANILDVQFDQLSAFRIDTLFHSFSQANIDSRLRSSVAEYVFTRWGRSENPAIAALALKAWHSSSNRVMNHPFHKKQAAEYLLDLTLLDQNLTPSSTQKDAILLALLTNKRENRPSGANSFVHAGADNFFFGIESVPIYWSHLLNRYPDMPEIDQRYLDSFWQLEQALPPKKTWYDLAKELYSGDPKTLSLLTELGRAHGAMTAAHWSVIKKFLQLPLAKYQDFYGARGGLTSNLTEGTTKLRIPDEETKQIDPDDLLPYLHQKRLPLLQLR